MSVFDIQLPNITDASLNSAKERKAILEALYQTNEQLRYVLNNIEMENLSAELQEKIEPGTSGDSELEFRVEDAEKGIAQLRMAADAIALRVKDAEDDISELRVTADAIALRVENAENEVAQLILTADQIALRVEDAEKGLAQLDLTADAITLRVDDAENEIARLSVSNDEILARVQDAETGLAQLEITADGISAEVSGKVGYGEVISSINQTAEEITIDAQKLNLNGAITANGTFKIDTDGSMEVTGGTIGGWAVKEDQLMGGELSGRAIQGEVIRGSYMQIWPGTGRGSICPLYATSGEIREETTSDGVSIERDIVNYEDTTYMNEALVSTQGLYVNGIYSKDSLTSPDAGIAVGSPVHITHDGDGSNVVGYSLTATGNVMAAGFVQTSDARLKKDIEDISEEEAAKLILPLRPVAYRFRKGDGHVHHGFIAQEVPENMRYHSCDGYLAVSYSDMMAPLVKLVQKQERRIRALESRLNMTEVE